MKRTLAPGLHDAGVDQALQMMAEGRSGEIDVFLNRSGGGSLGACLDDETQDGEAHGVPEGPELLRMVL